MNHVLSTQNIFADLLPPVCGDPESVALHRSGTVWVRHKGHPVFQLYKTLNDRDDVQLAFDSVRELLGETANPLTETSPRYRKDISLIDNKGQAVDVRITAHHPSIAPGSNFPTVVLQIGDIIYRPNPTMKIYSPNPTASNSLA